MNTSRLARLTLPLVAAALIAPLAVAPASAADDVDLETVQLEATERDTDSIEVTLEPADALAEGDRVLSPSPEVEATAAGDVNGRVLIAAPGGGSAVPAASGEAVVSFWRLESGTYFFEGRTNQFDEDGDFTIPNLTAGTYRIQVVANVSGQPGKAYYLDGDFWYEADDISFNEGAQTNLPAITVSAHSIQSGRIAGPDRYSTSVALSQSVTGDSGVDVVYLVSGAGYADALSAGPAAANEGGVLLLTQPNALPSVVAAELRRLDPSRVVIVGGTSAVSSRVARQVGDQVDAEVVRISGVDRYATSRAVVGYVWADGVDSVAIATGRNFPDALAAGAAIATRSGAVVLVDGSRSSLDSASRTFLTSMDPGVVAIAGGTASVSTGIANGIVNLPGDPEVVRLGGDDRFETARLINAQFFTGLAPDYAFLATGRGFADALAGGPVAAAFGAPIYLSEQRCLSRDVFADLTDLFVREVYGIGGTAVLSDRVLFGSLC